MSKTKDEFWSIMYTHKHGVDSWVEIATDAASALSQAITTVNGECPDHPFDADRENIEVAPFRAPDGYKLVRIK